MQRSTARARRALLLAVALVAGAADARINELEVTADSRRAISIGDFGFQPGGHLVIQVDGFKIIGPKGIPARGAFLFHKVENQVTTIKDVEFLAGNMTTCIADIDRFTGADVAFEFGADAVGPVSRTHNVTIKPGQDGLYELIYERCSPSENAKTSFRLRAEFVNPGGNYLSAGEIPLPAMYILFGLLFGGAAAAWIVHLRAHAEKIHTVHHLMTVLVVAKALTALTQGIQFAAINAVGHPTGWSALFYILLFVKGLLFFVAVLLIGTGWSLLKPFLSDRERRILMVVLPLQTLANTAIIVLDEIAPGSAEQGSWSVVLHLAEGACCVAVLFPTAWSIRSLNSAAAADGKAKEALDRLVRFRNFFVGTMGFLYFTRFGSYAMELMAAYSMLWTVRLFVETLTLAYYLGVGWAFRPGADNPYMRVRADSGDDGEFGLGDEGVDTTSADVGDDGEMLASAEEGRGATQAAKVLAEATKSGAAAAAPAPAPASVTPKPPPTSPPAEDESDEAAAARLATKAAKD